MVTKLSHMSLFVINQQEAKEFYTQKLGFKLHTDEAMDNGFTWVTVCPPEQPDLEITLLEVKPGLMFDEESAAQLISLLNKGKMGAGVFETSDCKKDYEELKAKGVEFLSPPKERFYGLEALFKDNSGNWFSLTQR